MSHTMKLCMHVRTHLINQLHRDVEEGGGGGGGEEEAEEGVDVGDVDEWQSARVVVAAENHPDFTYSQKTRLCSRSTVASWSLLPQEHATTALLCAFFRVLRCCADSRFQSTTPPSAAALPTTPWAPATKSRKTQDIRRTGTS